MPPNSTDDLDKSDRGSSYMSSSFITVVFLLLARGFSPTRRSPLRRTSDDEDHYRGDDGDRPPSELPVAVAFGGRRRHILLSSSHWPLPSALTTLLLSDAAQDHYRGDDGDRPPSELPVAVAFGGRHRHILLSSSHWPLPSALLSTLMLSDAAPSSLTSRSSFSSSLFLM